MARRRSAPPEPALGGRFQVCVRKRDGTPDEMFKEWYGHADEGNTDAHLRIAGPSADGDAAAAAEPAADAAADEVADAAADAAPTTPPPTR